MIFSLFFFISTAILLTQSNTFRSRFYRNKFFEWTNCYSKLKASRKPFYASLMDLYINGDIKTTGCSKVESAFYPSKVDQMSTRKSWGLSGKKSLSPWSGSAVLGQLNHIYKKEPQSFLNLKAILAIQFLL